MIWFFKMLDKYFYVLGVSQKHIAWSHYMYFGSKSETRHRAQRMMTCSDTKRQHPGPWFNIKMSSYQYRKSHCGDKTILRPSYLPNGISYTGKMTSLYWIRAQDLKCQHRNACIMQVNRKLGRKCCHLMPHNYDGNAWCNHRKNAKNFSQNRNEMTYSESKPYIMKLEGFLVYMSVQAYYDRSCSESSVVSDPFPETDKCYLTN